MTDAAEATASAASPDGGDVRSQDETGWRDVFVSAQDGLRLHGRDYGPRNSPAMPVVCLPGLTRNARDFHELAVRLATDDKHPRRVLSIDFRGRGESGFDPDWKSYSPLVEMNDVLDMTTACGIHRACFVGTSRGGLVTMLIAAARPTLIGAAILNDVGPELDVRGLIRIKKVLGATNQPADWPQAIAGMKRAYEAHFPALDAAGWDLYARRTYRDENGKPARDYDAKLLKTLETIDYNQPLATLWPQFDGLGHAPVLVIRGEHSDILSPETLAKMAKRRDDLQSMEVGGEGHAPLLHLPETLDRIADFVKAADRSST